MKKALTVLTLVLFLSVFGFTQNLATVIGVLGARESTLTIFKQYAVTDDLTVPANITLKFLQGGSVLISDTKTLTINGRVEAGLYEIFEWAGTGKVSFGPGSTREVYPQWWGAKGDGATDDTASIQAAIDGASAGSTLRIPATTSYYEINDDLDVAKALTIAGDGEASEIRQIVDAKRGFNITVSNVTIKNLRLYGHSAPDPKVGGAEAIRIVGTAGDPPTYITNVKIVDCFIENWGMYGIYSAYLNNSEFSRNYIKSISYAGIMGISVTDGIINNNRIDTIGPDSNSGNSYGIAITRSTGAEDLIECPRSARIVIVNNVVTNVPQWDGISTHGAENSFFNNNTVRSTLRGINCVAAGTYASLNCTISNNVVDIGSVAAGESSSGIGIAGYDASNLATGAIVGNIIIGHGDEDSVISGGLSIKFTQGFTIIGNRLIGCASRGIMIYQHNYAFTVSGNTISDVWSDTHNIIAIQVNSVNNTGYIGENSWQDVTSTGDYYFGAGAPATNSYGIYINNAANNAISLGNNYHEDADTYISDLGGKAITHEMITGLTMTGTLDITGQVEQARAATSTRYHIETYATDPNTASAIYIRTSDSDTLGTLNETENGDRLGTIYFQGVDDGSNFEHGAYIRAKQVAAAGITVPTSLEFSTHTDTARNANQLLLTSSGKVGIKTSTPDGDFHIHRATAGAVAADTNSIAVLENNADAYLSFLVPVANESGILFGEMDDNNAGGIYYNSGNAADGLDFRVGGNVSKVRILLDGGVMMISLKSGINQGAAGAAAGELWIDTSDGNTIKMGT